MKQTLNDRRKKWQEKSTLFNAMIFRNPGQHDMLPLFLILLNTMITKNTTAETGENYTALSDLSQLGLLLMAISHILLQ